MAQEFLVAILAGLGGMLGWGLADLFAKKTIDEIGDTLSLMWAHVFGTLGFLSVVSYKFFVLNEVIYFPTSLNTWAGLLFFGALQAIIYLLVYKGFGKGQVSVLNPVFASFSGVTVIFSILFFGELLSGGLLLALVIIFLGIILVNLDSQILSTRKVSFIKTPGFEEIGMATLLAAFWTIMWDRFINGADALVYAFLMYLFMTIVIFFFVKRERIPISVNKSSMWKFLILIGLCETVAYLGVSIGYSQTKFTSVVALLSGAFSLPTILLARVFLKEKVTKVQTIGSIIIITGIIFLSVL